MYAVIFEVEPEPDRLQDYLDIAGRLRPELEKIDGSSRSSGSRA
jgi:hypothetical protein